VHAREARRQPRVPRVPRALRESIDFEMILKFRAISPKSLGSSDVASLPATLLLVAVLGMIRATSYNSSINDSIRRGQKRRTTEKLRANKERIHQFRRLGFSRISNGSQHGLSSQSSSLPSSSSSQSVLLSRFGRRGDVDEKIQTIVDNT